ncbi:hypothetical protein MAMT_01808 [Methylacidimicrobium tartarophylax]|uniref:Transposase IS204/IS1001/IS1096/IS1165 DDE domain-containing protein n=1 Tax=Methylacidimicrobium tartarophylax TaxID=1041768 RepID=A0A5E6MDM7_9BACT|nr:hypothetical protein MAMT_01808 [Methylacidimicrobium tartarophylax]
MMEAVILMRAPEMSVSQVARILKEQDTRLWRISEQYVGKAYRKEDLSGVKRILVDEISRKQAHRYVTAVTDAESRKLLFLAEGKGKETLEAFTKEMREHGAAPEQIELIYMDMSPARFPAPRSTSPGRRPSLTASTSCRWRERQSIRCARSSCARGCCRKEASGRYEATNGREAGSRRVCALPFAPPTHD